MSCVHLTHQHVGFGFVVQQDDPMEEIWGHGDVTVYSHDRCDTELSY